MLQDSTRVTDSSSTLIDHGVYVSHNLKVIESEVSCICISDHFPVAVALDIKNKLKSNGHYVVSFIECMFKQILFHDMKELKWINDLEDKLREFNRNMLGNIESYALVKSHMRNELQTPWINKRE